MVALFLPCWVTLIGGEESGRNLACGNKPPRLRAAGTRNLPDPNFPRHVSALKTPLNPATTSFIASSPDGHVECVQPSATVHCNHRGEDAPPSVDALCGGKAPEARLPVQRNPRRRVTAACVAAVRPMAPAWSGQDATQAVRGRLDGPRSPLFHDNPLRVSPQDGLWCA